MMTRRTTLLIIDPQNDFCDLPEAERGSHVPALPVPGAHQDMLRLAKLIAESADRLTDITVTLDSHQHLDIAHTTFWKTAAG